MTATPITQTIGGQRVRIIAPYKPTAWQVAAWLDKSPTVLLTGSAGGGKSRLAGEKLHGFCKKYPGAMALMVRKTRESMTNSTVLFMDRTVIGRDPSVAHYSTKRRFEYANGSILAYGGMADEDQREQIRSIGQEGRLDIVWMEEATGFVEDDYNEILARMRGRAADWRQIILSTNPAHPNHWINRRLIHGGGAAVHYSHAKDNPHNPASYEQTLASLTGVLGKRLRDGLWVQAEGAVYSEFSPEVHVRERKAADFKCFLIGIDEGYVNPAVALLIGLDGDERAHVLDELYVRGMVQEAFVQEVARWGARYQPDGIYVDPSAAGLVASLRNLGLPVVSAANDVLDGIQAVKAMLALAGDGRPRLTIQPTCSNMIAEMEAYVWQVSREGIAQDKPVKEMDHAADGLRYVMLGLARAYSGAEARGMELLEVVQSWR